MADTTDTVWAVDRETSEPGEYAPAFIASFPNRFLRIDAPKSTKAAGRSSSKPPKQGDNTEGGA